MSITFPPLDAEHFFRTYAIGAIAVSKDEQRIAFATNLSGVYNLWGMDLPGGYPYPLSTMDQVPHHVEFDPHGRFILATFDHDGDENTQVYLLPPFGGPAQPLRTAPGRRFYVTGLSKDGERLYYCSDKDEPMYLAGYVYHIAEGKEERLYTGEQGACYLAAVAPDESSFVVMRHYANTHAPAFLHRGEEIKPITPDPAKPHVTGSMVYAGDVIYMSTDYDSDFMYIAAYHIGEDRFERCLAIEGHDIHSLARHEATGRIWAVVSRGVEDKLLWFDPATGEHAVLNAPCTSVSSLSVGDSGRVYVTGTTEAIPSNLYVREVDGTWRALTNNRVMGITAEEQVRAEVKRFRSFDGMEIEALWFPANPRTANGYTVVWPHGGPQSMERRWFRAFFNYLCYKGYNVWAPNYRGSTGYGHHFATLVERDWGHGPRLDMVASVEWLIAQGLADRDKLFLVGGSYGGYMTLLLHGRHPDLFRAYVDIFGPSNLFTFLHSVPEHWKPAMKQWLGDADDPEDQPRLTADSPITYLENMTRPMLVIQGANDPRVVKAESDQIVEALRQRGVDVEYIVFDDEGHGFTKKSNEIKAYRRVVEFLDAHREAGESEH